MRCTICFPVYATTAANSHESSYACYYDSKRDTFLGDLYSVNWMEDSDEASTSVHAFLKNYRLSCIKFCFFLPEACLDKND